VDSDLADAVETLKAIFAKRKLPCSFGKTPQPAVDDLRKQLRVPARYRNFLLGANPEKVETVTPVERIRLIPSGELVKAQDLVKTPGASPVFTAMSGQDRWIPTLAASSFAQFLRILSTAMEIAAGFGDAIMDDEDEDSFREALGPKVKTIDAAALRAGHWT
jgi:hypothetical protein